MHALLCAVLLAPPINPPGLAKKEMFQVKPNHTPLNPEAYHHTPPERVELGRLLFYDKVLSGNLNISCATCHHGHIATADGLALPIGEGGIGLGMARLPGGAVERVPRHSPGYWNLGHSDWTQVFWDGRVSVAEDGSFVTPAGDELPDGLDHIMSAQALFPITSADEMAGQPGQNPQADLVNNLPALWTFVLQKVTAIPEYVTLFQNAFPDVSGIDDITVAHLGNALGAFGTSLRADNTPYDQHLRGEASTLSKEAWWGMQVFFKDGQCASCHWSPGGLLSDMQFHAIAVPQIGPGKGDGDGHEDFGRERVTGRFEDRYRFRTPPLRNVALTPPYGHTGAFDTLEAMVWHHLDAVGSLHSYDRSQAALPPRPDFALTDFTILDNPTLVGAIADANELEPIELTDSEFRRLIAFLRDGLTDARAYQSRQNVPFRVPSGLPVAD